MFNFGKEDTTRVWDLYKKGVDWHNKNQIYYNTDRAHAFYEGDQWRDAETGDEELPILNFLTPIVKFKTAMIAMNNMSINYSSLNQDRQELFAAACELLNLHAAKKWELNKMDTLMWEVITNAMIGGDSYLFFYNKNLDAQVIDRANIYLSDEQCSNMQKQKYAILYERRFVDEVKADAAKNGIPEEQIMQIVGDQDTTNLPESQRGNEVKSDSKCSCLLYIEKKPLPPPNMQPYGIFVSRSTKTVIYQPEQKIEGLTTIPIVNYIVGKKRGSSRGTGVVIPLIPNQITVNQVMARRAINLKVSGYPKPVYNRDLIENPEDITNLGAAIEIAGQTVQKVQDAFAYISAEPISPDAANLQAELISVSRELMAAGDNATGNINPERASGSAIVAVRDQQNVANTEAIQAYKQMIEDIALIWLDMLIAYNPNGLSVSVDGEDDQAETMEVIPAEILRELQVNVKVDVSPSNPFSKSAREDNIKSTLDQKYITFEEYVDALGDDSYAPKQAYEKIIEKRKQIQLEQEQSELAQLREIVQRQSKVLNHYQGGQPVQNPEEAQLEGQEVVDNVM